MTGCCVPGCKNRSKKGENLYMARFPADTSKQALRDKWISNIIKHSSKKDWKPTRSSVVCEVHFTDEMWETVRVDGRRKLKRHIAVPTRFFEPVDHCVQILDPSTVIQFLPSPPREDDSDDNIQRSSNSICDGLQNQTSSHFSINEKRIKELEEKLKVADRLISRCWREKLKWKKTYRRLTKENFRLKTLLSKIKLSLKSMLNVDQMVALSRKTTKGCNWSNETIKKSLKLKLACGPTGYDELRAQNIPLPSLRTLRRKLKGISYEEEILKKNPELVDEVVDNFVDKRGEDSMLILDEMALKPERDSKPAAENFDISIVRDKINCVT